MRAALILLLVPLHAAAQSWTPLVDEGQSFNVPADSVVRYGANGNWVALTMSGAGQCTNAFFKQDPAVMTRKSCQVRDVCVPKDLGGTGTAALFEFTNVGAAVGWWCGHTERPVKYGATWSWLAANPAVSKAVADLRGASNPVAQVNTLLLQSGARPMPADAFPALDVRLAAMKPPFAPPAPAPTPWWVRKAPSNASPAGTRPIYRRSANDRLVQDYGRIIEFATCDCALDRFPSTGTPTHCSVNGVREQLALCEPRP